MLCGPPPPHCTFPNSENLTAAVVQDQRPLRVAVMSAAASGTSKAAHGDAGLKKKKGPGALATAYLVIYNVVMTAGYVACFLLLTLLCWSMSVFVCCWERELWRSGARFILGGILICLFFFCYYYKHASKVCSEITLNVLRCVLWLIQINVTTTWRAHQMWLTGRHTTRKTGGLLCALNVYLHQRVRVLI